MDDFVASIFSTPKKKSDTTQNPFDILSDLFKSQDTPWWRYLWKIFSVTGAAAGVPPNVIFSNEFTEELFGKDEELLIIWAQIGSGAVNFAINFNSFEEIPDVIRKIPDIVNKLHFDIETKCDFKVLKVKVLLAVLTSLMINVGAFLSNYQFAIETSAKFTDEYHLKAIVLWSQLAAAVALVSRSTFNLAIKKLLPEQQETAKIIKKRFLGEFNNCIEEKDRLTSEEIDALADGKLKQGDSTTLSYSLATLPILVVLFYSGAFGISAYEAAASLTGGTSAWWQKGFAFFGAGASSIAKAFLLSNSVINMTDIISRSCGEEILPELSDSMVANVAGGSALFLTLVWNTPFGASWVVQEHLLKLLTDNVFIQMLVSGITGSVAALPINFLDSFFLAKKMWNWGENKCCPKEVAEYGLYIKGLMKMMAETSSDEMIRCFIGEKYLSQADAMEKGALLHQEDPTFQAVFEKMGAILNEKFFEVIRQLKILQEISPRDKQTSYEEFAKIPSVPLTNVVVGNPEYQPPRVSINNGIVRPKPRSSEDGGSASPLDRGLNINEGTSGRINVAKGTSFDDEFPDNLDRTKTDMSTSDLRAIRDAIGEHQQQLNDGSQQELKKDSSSGDLSDPSAGTSASGSPESTRLKKVDAGKPTGFVELAKIPEGDEQPKPPGSSLGMRRSSDSA